MSRVEFERCEIERLLGLLDARLQERGVPGSVCVVGGAAIAATVHDAPTNRRMPAGGAVTHVDADVTPVSARASVVVLTQAGRPLIGARL